MPISADPKETRKLFFWFWPSNNPAHADDLLFWTNGGTLHAVISILMLITP
jgi:carboxypeptidase D